MREIKVKYYDFAVSDFDGTLADSCREVSEDTIKYIKEFQSRGGTFSVCTGRMSGAILPKLRKYGLKGLYICYNGAEICDIESGEKIYKNHVDNAACIKILKYAEAKNYDVIVYPSDKITVHKITENIEDYMRLTEQKCVLTDEKVSEIFARDNLTSGKVLVYTDGSEGNGEKIVSDLKEILGDGYNIGRSNISHVDITKSGVSKGSAVIELSRILNKDMKKLICFGDELNDKSMLEIAAFSVVTANGNENIKKFADVVTDDSDHDGVKNAMQKYCI